MWLRLDGRGPLQRQLYVALRDAILGGAFEPGKRIPSSRDLARTLGVSRNTVLLALEQLIGGGYLVGRRGSGTFVTSELPAARSRTSSSHRLGGVAAPAALEPRLSRSAQAVAKLGLVPSWQLRRDPRAVDFRYGESAFQDLPLATWARLYARHVRRARAGDLAYQAPNGEPRLRQAIAAYLGSARGVHCSAEQVLVTAGSQQAIDLCLRVLIDPGDRVAIEEPCYPGLRIALMHARAKISAIAVDDGGLCVDQLTKQRGVRLVCVTPSHQFPTGALMPAARRLALLAWASSQRAYVLEDDYDGEFRYAGRPLETLHGCDARHSVLYVGTFSKVLFPALRLGYVVLPDPLIAPFLRAKAACDTGSTSLEQQVLAEFMRAGHFERHVRRTRARNAARHAALLEAIAGRLGERVRVGRQPAGLHVWLQVPSVPAEQASAFAAHARSRGVVLHSAAVCFQRQPACAAFILGYAALNERRIDLGITRLAQALDEYELLALRHGARS